jgi:hypothetical protein
VTVCGYFLVIDTAIIKYQQRFRFGAYRSDYLLSFKHAEVWAFRAYTEALPTSSPQVPFLMSMITLAGQIRATKSLQKIKKEMEQQACALVLVEVHRRPLPDLEASTGHKRLSGC